jgi:hypothetical protein
LNLTAEKKDKKQQAGRRTRRREESNAGVMPHQLPSSFSWLYCAELIPITAPMNTAIADRVPTISSARGRFQILESAK